MKNLRNIILMTILILLFTLLIVKQDIKYYDVKNEKIIDIEDEYFLFSITKSSDLCTRGQCWELRWYPFPMTEKIPILHQWSIFLWKNIIYNFIIYFIWTLAIIMLYNKLFLRHDKNINTINNFKN